MDRGKEHFTCEMTLDETQIMCNWTVYYREGHYWPWELQKATRDAWIYWLIFGISLSLTTLFMILKVSLKFAHERYCRNSKIIRDA